MVGEWFCCGRAAPVVDPDKLTGHTGASCSSIASFVRVKRVERGMRRHHA